MIVETRYNWSASPDYLNESSIEELQSIVQVRVYISWKSKGN